MENMATQAWQVELNLMVKTLADSKSLHSDIRYSAVHDGSDTADDVLCAKLHVRLARALLGSRLATLTGWTFSLPGFFGGLLHHEADQRTACRASLKDWWEKLCKLEELALGDSFYHKLLEDILWPLGSWNKEVLAAMTLRRCLTGSLTSTSIIGHMGPSGPMQRRRASSSCGGKIVVTRTVVWPKRQG